jgi:FlaA1/EpsC-like NDP-sugar epimerase
MGVENIIQAATACNVKYVLFTSSDKAVNPTNVMGTSKLMGERLITAANAVKNASDTILSSTRFGNVIGSRGSVVPLFLSQIKNGGPVTLTDERMTRFIMTVQDSARMVLKSLAIAKGGEVFVTKMPVVRIFDLAEAMIELLAPKFGYNASDIDIVKIGAKPGEKLYEELMSEEEVHRSIELKDMFVITPAFKSIYRSIKYEYPNAISDQVQGSYISATEVPLSKEAVKEYLIENRVIDEVETSLTGVVQ